MGGDEDDFWPSADTVALALCASARQVGEGARQRREAAQEVAAYGAEEADLGAAVQQERTEHLAEELRVLGGRKGQELF